MQIICLNPAFEKNSLGQNLNLEIKLLKGELRGICR